MYKIMVSKCAINLIMIIAIVIWYSAQKVKATCFKNRLVPALTQLKFQNPWTC